MKGQILVQPKAGLSPVRFKKLLAPEGADSAGSIPGINVQIISVPPGKAWHTNSEVSQRLASIPGIGVLTATTLAASVGEGHDFKNGRQLAAYLGLVPRQASSGGKDRLLGISKRGDGYLRSLLIHGARAVIHHIRRRLKAGRPGGNPWVEQLLQRCHINEVAVALAKKMARTAWVLLARNETYCLARPV